MEKKTVAVLCDHPHPSGEWLLRIGTAVELDDSDVKQLKALGVVDDAKAAVEALKADEVPQ